MAIYSDGTALWGLGTANAKNLIASHASPVGIFNGLAGTAGVATFVSLFAPTTTTQSTALFQLPAASAAALGRTYTAKYTGTVAAFSLTATATSGNINGSATANVSLLSGTSSNPTIVSGGAFNAAGFVSDGNSWWRIF
jgi:hypothetical protein